MHRNDIVVATDDVARGDFVVPNLAEDTGGESRKTIGTGVVSRVGEAKDVEPTDPKLSGAMFAIAEAGGFEGSDRGEIVGSVAGIHREEAWRRASSSTSGGWRGSGASPAMTSSAKVATEVVGEASVGRQPSMVVMRVAKASRSDRSRGINVLVTCPRRLP